MIEQLCILNILHQGFSTHSSHAACKHPYSNTVSPAWSDTVTWYHKTHFINVHSIWNYLLLWATVQLNKEHQIKNLSYWWMHGVPEKQLERCKQITTDITVLFKGKQSHSISHWLILLENYRVICESICNNKFVEFLINCHKVSTNCPHIRPCSTWFSKQRWMLRQFCKWLRTRFTWTPAIWKQCEAFCIVTEGPSTVNSHPGSCWSLCGSGPNMNSFL